jgi:hypothetical protein
MQMVKTGIAHVNLEHMAAISIRYELMALEDFINGQCFPVNTEEGIAAGKIRRWEQFVDSECKKIRANMTGQVLSIAKPRHIELYIQHHQAGIIDLSDSLWKNDKKEEGTKDEGWFHFYKGLQQQLSALLEFLKHYFDSYFDHYQNVPRYYLEERVQQIFGSYLMTLAKPMEKHKVIFAPIKEYWQSIAEGRTYQISFHKEQYFETFFKVISKKLSHNCGEEELLELLLQFKYNDSRFMDYCRYGLIAALAEIESEEDQITFLAERIKQLKQIPVRKINAYTPSNPDIIGFCQQWMEEEYHFIQNRISLRQNIEKSERQLPARNPKLETQLPVAQFGILLHLIHYSGAIRLKNKTAFINFFAQNLVTRDNERISGKNLRNSYYNIDSKSVAPIKDLLYTMLKQLKEFE